MAALLSLVPNKELETEEIDGPEQPAVASADQKCLGGGVGGAELLGGLEGEGDGR